VRRILAGAAVLAVVLAGCGGEEPTFPDGSFIVIANRDIGTGPNRVLLDVAQADGGRLGSPEHQIEVEISPIDHAGAVQRVPGVFTWMVEGAAGLYRADFDFDAPGSWAVTVHPESGDPLPWFPITVLAETFAPNVGELAPVAPTPTLDELAIEELTTDPDPDPRFYELSLEEAIASGRKTVLVFSTPAYCQTAACGPLLIITKELASDHPDVNFIHVEVYTGLADPDFAPDPAHLAPAVGAEYWNLQSEPWVFVIDETGTVSARFEGVMGHDELTAQLG
jgi:hypothetical protein